MICDSEWTNLTGGEKKVEIRLSPIISENGNSCYAAEGSEEDSGELCSAVNDTVKLKGHFKGRATIGHRFRWKKRQRRLAENIYAKKQRVVVATNVLLSPTQSGKSHDAPEKFKALSRRRR